MHQVLDARGQGSRLSGTGSGQDQDARSKTARGRGLVRIECLHAFLAAPFTDSKMVL